MPEKHRNYRYSRNPILPGQGVCDPHVRVFNNRFYLYATHDASPENERFVMRDWWIWSSNDLVDWKHECTLNPRDTWLGDGFGRCWATDAIERDGSYYWYISEGADSTTVLKAETPVGPWTDVLKGPLLQRADLGGAAAHDPSLLIDDDGRAYMIVGYKQYYLLELNDDMVSLSGPARRVEVINPTSPLGAGTLDDKPTLHKRAGIYYLSWGCFYAVSDCIEGPYECKGSFLQEENIDPALRPATGRVKGFTPAQTFGDQKWDATYDRHGSFFEYAGQWYFICNDHASSGNAFFRDSVIARVDYHDNGDIRPVHIDAMGVKAVQTPINAPLHTN